MTDKSFKIIAHRGASGYLLENSFSAFQKAIELNADMIETDVRRTKDGHLPLIHDPTVNRTAFGTGAVSNLTLVELKEIKLLNYENIPLVDEVLEKFGNKVEFNLEIKARRTEKKINNLLEQFDLFDRIIISSFSLNILRKFRATNSNFRIAALIPNFPWKLLRLRFTFKKLQNLNIEALNPIFKIVSEELVTEAHDHGLEVYPWTVDDKDFIIKLRDQYKVDGIFTNYPDILQK